MPSRRHIIAACSGIVGTSLTGCLSSSPSGTVTPTETCSATTPPAPTTAATSPRQYPERPADLTTATLNEFLKAYETAYQYNDALAANPDKIGRTNELTVDVRSVSIESNNDRFIAKVEGQLQTDFIDSRSPTHTPEPPTETPLPAGHGPFEASYVATTRELRREDVVVECW